MNYKNSEIVNDVNLKSVLKVVEILKRGDSRFRIIKSESGIFSFQQLWIAYNRVRQGYGFRKLRKADILILVKSLVRNRKLLEIEEEGRITYMRSTYVESMNNYCIEYFLDIGNFEIFEK